VGFHVSFPMICICKTTIHRLSEIKLWKLSVDVTVSNAEV